MKNFLLSLPIMVFPYAFILIALKSGGDFILQGILFWFLVFIYSLAVAAINVGKRRDCCGIAKWTMIVKLVQIPSYILFFLIGAIFVLVPKGFILSIWIILLDVLTIILSGIIGVTGVINGYREKQLSLLQFFVFGICQFIFCVDVICAILVWLNLRKRKVNN